MEDILDIEKIKQLAELVNEQELDEIEIEQKGVRIRIRHQQPAPTTIQMSAAPAPMAPAAAPVKESAPATTVPTPAADDKNIRVITSPMVGTFYRSAAPDRPPFVEVGSAVRPDTTVCILEAMKIMNEITADLEGTIVDILVSDGQAVEYGQPLFKVRV